MAVLELVEGTVKKATWSERLAMLAAGLVVIATCLAAFATGTGSESQTGGVGFGTRFGPVDPVEVYESRGMVLASIQDAREQAVQQPPSSGFVESGAGESREARKKKPPKKLLWAVVDETGTLVRDRGALEASLLGNGGFEILFDRNVAGCSYQATIGRPRAQAAVAPTGHVSASPDIGKANGVFVQTNDLNHGFVGRPFHLAVFCP